MKFKLTESQHKLIAYNGSDKKFNKFSNNTKGQTIGTDQFDIPGIYFSNDIEMARNYACGNSAGSYTDENNIEHSFYRPPHKGYLYTCELNYKKPIIIDYKAAESNTKDSDIAWNKRQEVQNNIKDYINNGYDIVILKNIKYTDKDGNPTNQIGNEYIVLNPDIINILNIEECQPMEEME